MTRWIPVIGLEVHAQLDTRTKLFCACRTSFGAPPNSNTCPVCTGQPGVLPVLNKEALRLAVRGGIALGCDIASWSRFDRKHYFYLDLPKGYQITQYERPYCTGGGIEIAPGRFIRLTRIHMEEDAGKAIHDRGAGSLVDLNRAGTPLIESVTEADIQSADEARRYLSLLKETLQYTGVSGCDMEKGELRCDVNISVHPEGEPWRTKVEIKNLNSFRFVEAAIEYEIARQVEAYESGDESRYPVQETRLFDPDAGVTRTMRVKEDEDDYRYFTEPDLPPVTVDAVFLASERGYVPEPASARRERYVQGYELSETEARTLTSTRTLSDFFEATLRASKGAREVCGWIVNELMAALSDEEVSASSVEQMSLRPQQLAELIQLVDEDAVNRKGARLVLRKLIDEGGDPERLIVELGLEQVQDTAQIEAWCREVLAEMSNVADEVRAGNPKALGALMGPVMKASGGKADPKEVRATLARLIEAES